MAWTNSLIKAGVDGQRRFFAYSMTADSAEQHFRTGLNKILRFEIGQQLLTDGAAGYTYANSGSTGTACMGMLGMSGFTSGNEIFITVYGN